MLLHHAWIRPIDLLTGEDIPADADHLVGERDNGDLSVASRLHAPEPYTEGRLVSLEP